jgi:ferredoxin
MGDKHRVRFEPVGIEIEVDEEQTVLRSASEQGLMLMHGCKEGQCAACKSFVLDGEDIELDKYSTFALPDFEKDEGFTLLCRAHVYEDVTIELLNYDEEMIKSGLPLQRATAEVAAIEEVTHDLRHVTLTLLDPTELRYFPGQYVDVTVPQHGVTRSFSMAGRAKVEYLSSSMSSPWSTNDLQAAHWPSLQPCMSMSPCSEAARRIVCSSPTSISMPTGSNRTRCLSAIPTNHPPQWRDDV